LHLVREGRFGKVSVKKTPSLLTGYQSRYNSDILSGKVHGEFQSYVVEKILPMNSLRHYQEKKKMSREKRHSSPVHLQKGRRRPLHHTI